MQPFFAVACQGFLIAAKGKIQTRYELYNALSI